MEFDEIVVKESPGLCRCCLSEGCYKDMGTEYTWMNENEVYADMLLECFDIGISQHNDGPNGPNRLICEVCITRLRDACNFKKQVIESEKKFVDMIGRGEFRPKVLIYQSQMKTEAAEDVIEETEVEYLEEDFGDFDDDDTPREEQPSVSDPLPPVRNKRGRPKKNPEQPEKKKKAEGKAKIIKGPKRLDASEARRKSSQTMTSTWRNRLIKENAVVVLENTTALPFKWHRQHFLCFYCHKHFEDPESMKDHTKSDHKDSTLRSAVSFLRRDEKVKIDLTNPNCKLCNQNLDSLDEIINHLKGHGKVFNEECGFGLVPYKLQGVFACAVCKKEFQYFVKLNQHMNEHFGSYICELCGKTFLSHDRLRCHALRHGSRFQCKACPESFETLTQKTSHESKVHNISKVRQCSYCPETFANYSLRKRHHKLSHNIEVQEYNCPVCGKTFQIMSKMKIHLKEVHMREKNFTCMMCEQKFFSRTHLQKHMVKHFGERLYQCEVCFKSYPRKQTLKDHMRTHSKDKKLNCPICNQEFIPNGSLRLHMKVHHPEVSTDNRF